MNREEGSRVSHTDRSGRPATGHALHRFAMFLAGCTLVLIFAGGLVTSTGSGLAVPDWPLSFGTLFPAMRGGVLFEHGHRLVAGFVALLTAALAAWAWLGAGAAAVRRLAGLALLAVLLQALLGGLTVLWRLPTWVSVTHACLAQAFLCLVVGVAVVSAPARPASRGVGGRRLARLATVGTALIFLQLVLGALVRHLGAGLAFRDFPLAGGRLLPPLTTAGVTIHYLHRLGAVVVTAALVATAVQALRRPGRDPRLIRPAVAAVTLAVVQIGLGATIIWSLKAVVPTTAHVATGAALLAASLVTTIRAWQAAAPHRAQSAPLRAARWPLADEAGVAP